MLQRSTIARTALAVAFLGGPALITSLWMPVITHYQVDAPAITAGIVASAVDNPDNKVLEELGSHDHYAYSPLAFPEQARNAVSLAEGILDGSLRLVSGTDVAVSSRFDPAQFATGPSADQLRNASLAIPGVLLAAYEVSGEENYFDVARNYILAVAQFDKQRWFPHGFLWNDHALAGRAPVLTEFWRIYRSHDSFDARDARHFLEFVETTRARLAKPSLYTYATNHGAMQNLALLHLAASFPALPRMAESVELAVRRLEQLLQYYVNDEGVILEHSAGYHVYGTEILATILRYMTLLGQPIPAEWSDRYRRAENFYAALRRPDGSLPRIGNTKTQQNAAGSLVTNIADDGSATSLHFRDTWRPLRDSAMYPAAGFAVWWRGLDSWPDSSVLSQTTVTWSYYPGHGHKHADDLSFNIWAGGVRWLTSVGYWPYDIPGWKEGTSWQGANAPHVMTELLHSDRSSRLLASAMGERLNAVDLLRNGPQGLKIRRQLIQADTGVWLSIDTILGAADGTARTVWLSDAGARIRPVGSQSAYEISQPGRAQRMMLHILANPPASTAENYGDDNDLLGWVEQSGDIAAAPAVVVEGPANDARRITVFSLLNADEPTPAERPRLAAWENAEHWRLELPAGGGSQTISREGATIEIKSAATNAEPGLERKLTLEETAPDVQRTIDATHQALAKTESLQPPKHRDLIKYRLRLTWVLVVLSIANLLLLGFLRRRRGHALPVLSVLSIAAWAGMAWWIHAVYLVS